MINTNTFRTIGLLTGLFFLISSNTASMQTIQVKKDIPFGEVIDHKGNSLELLLDVYLPSAKVKPNGRVIVWVHGGGFRGGDRRQGYIVKLSRAFAEKGFVCISPEYRLREDPWEDLPGTISDAVSDLYLALQWVAGHGKTYGYDPEEIIVGGGSAGGVLLNHLCFGQNKRKINQRIECFINLWGSPFNKALISGIGKHDPPTLIIHGDKDELVPYHNSEMLTAGLKNAGVYHELHAFEGAGHTPIDQMDRIVGLIEGFLNNPEVNLH